MNELWGLTPPGPENLFANSAYLRLRDACGGLHPHTRALGFHSALMTALVALGLPCRISKNSTGTFARGEDAARALHEAFGATRSKRTHLVPMDLADDLPSLRFGTAHLRSFSAVELRDLFDQQGLKRSHPAMVFQAEQFSEFQWLVVEEITELVRTDGARALPDLLMDFSQDFGRIEPHQGQFPGSVEAALFFLLLAPWEDWSTMPGLDWRGFRVPWVYTVDHDIFVRRIAPPSSESLSWTVKIYDDDWGEAVEVDAPASWRLNDDAQTELANWNQDYWQVVQRARNSALFETPIVHFFVRAFLADGIDEFLAHMIAIEAALGLHADYDRSQRVAPDRHPKISASRRMRHRVTGLFKDRSFGDQYERLFNIRSSFLHGRSMSDISFQDRVAARSLARQVMVAIIQATETASITSREDFLEQLLDAGAQHS